MEKRPYIKRRDREDNLYTRLQNQSLEIVRQLSGNRWTDYNEHDPGVTILDVLNSALFELDYAFEAPFEEYLADLHQNELNLSKTGLLPPSEIFAPTIATADDYETLFIASVEGVRDCNVLLNENHLYDIVIDAAENASHDTIREQVYALYHRHRNLCENLGTIRFGKTAEKQRFTSPPHETPEYTDIPAHSYYAKKGYTYHTIQNDFPECYGIGERGLPSDASVQRKVEALHLKAYLLIFDYLLSGVSQQLKGVRDLLDLSDKLPVDFRPEIEIPGLENLLDEERLHRSPVFDRADMIARKKHFFDNLDALYGEDTGIYSQDRPLLFRAELIRCFPELNTQRFRSFEIPDRSMKSMPGIKRLINTLLGNKLDIEMSIINNFSRYNLKLIADDKFFNELQGVLSVEFLMEDETDDWSLHDVSEIPHVPHENSLKKYYRMLRQLNLFRHSILFEGFLRHGMNPDNFRCLHLYDQSGYLLLYKQPGRKERINLGFFFDKDRLIEICNCLWDFVRKLNRDSYSFYFIEHILLTEAETPQTGVFPTDHPSAESVSPTDRTPLTGVSPTDRTSPTDHILPAGETRSVPDDYNKLTIIIPRWIDNLYSKDTYMNIFEERLPAHLDVNYRWLGVEEIKSFEESYFKWRRALATNDKEQLTTLSKELAEKL